MAGISDKALKTPYAQNKYRYNNGTELQNQEFSDGSGLEMYETPYRGYDPQLGRFWQIDPIGEATPEWSPYLYAADNPIFFNDPLGLSDSVPGLKPYAPAPVVTPGSNNPVGLAFIPGSGSPGSPTVDIPPPPDEVPDIPITNPGGGSPSGSPTVEPLGEMNPEVTVVGPGLLGTLGLTIGLTILPNSMGHEGIPAPNPLFSRYVPDSKPDNDGRVTLYRGVDPSNPNFKWALQGMAVPLGLDGGHNDPTRHNEGDTYSIYTSWTSRPAVAAKFAGHYGVVLVKTFQLTPFMTSPDKYNEQEVLVPGIVTGATVEPAWVNKRL